MRRSVLRPFYFRRSMDEFLRLFNIYNYPVEGKACLYFRTRLVLRRRLRRESCDKYYKGIYLKEEYIRMAKTNPRRRWSLIVICVVLLLIGALTASAQATPTPVTIGQNTIGSITDPTAPVQYSLALGAPQSVNVQVLAVSQGFAPTFQILDPGGVVVMDTANPGTQTIVQGSPNLSSPGTYTIVIKSANNTAGQFLLSVQPGAPLAPPTPLTPGQPVSDSVSAQATRKAYSFAASQTDVLLLDVSSATTTSGPVITLRNADTNETLALNSAALAGIRYRLATGTTNYLVEITSSGASTPESFTLCLSTESGSVTCPGTTVASAPTATQVINVPNATPTLNFLPTPTNFSPISVIDPNGPCEVISNGSTINVRSGPGTGYSVLTKLAPTQPAQVIGRSADNTWYQINIFGTIGWVSAGVVSIGGVCSGVSVVVLPTAVPTSVPPPTEPNSPSATPTTMPTGVPTNTPTEVPTTSGTHTIHFPPVGIQVSLIAPIQVVPINPKLDYQAAAKYGEANLSNGFSPDPYSVGTTSGGDVDVSYLGGSCSGFASAAPDLRINFGGGGASLLRIYYVGANGDPAMVVNDPYGNFYCVDDSFGTVNPTIDFNNPAGGSYDVWIASYANNANISGTLYITGNSGNHP